VGYRRGTEQQPEEPRQGEHEDLIVLELSGRGVDMTHTLQLTRLVRQFLLGACPDPIPEWVSGHKPDGAPSDRSHVAYLPMPFVGRPHADGRVMGVALAIPRGISEEERTACVGRFLVDDLGLPMERQVAPNVSIRLADRRLYTLSPRAWTAPSTTWATVTPIAMHRWPKGNQEAIIADACQHAGLPEPARVALTPISPLSGVPPAREFPNLPRKKRFLTHAVISWDQKVAGPIVLGAGRYLGYGLLKQWHGAAS
jgi:CRISPR-associated protein Csb2